MGRGSPSSLELRRAFRVEESRSQRRSDGTISLKGRRFEVPSRFRHLKRIHVCYASWDLRTVDLVDPHTGAVVCPLYPQDKTANAEGIRRTLQDPGFPETLTPESTEGGSGMAPLLEELMEEYSATGLPPAYIPKSAPDDDQTSNSNDDDTEGLA